MDRNFRKFISVLLLIVATFFCIALIVKSRQGQELKSDLAHINHVEHGLFNMHEWKRKVADAISDKIIHMELDSTSKGDLKIQISKALNTLFDEVESTLDDGKKSSLAGAIKGVFVDVFVDKDKLRSKIPSYADKILDEFDKVENRTMLSQMIQSKLSELVEESLGEEDRLMIDQILSKYDQKHIEACSFYLEELIRKNRNELYAYAVILIIAFVLVFILSYPGIKSGNLRSSYFVLFGIFILLIAGVLCPMIDIDARIEKISLDFLGREIEFENQILFFQSKSILDVIIILLKNVSFQSILVGVLIGLFSLVFPLIKLSSTLIILKNPEKNKNKVLHFFAFYSGKWSMADVMVVAIFMAYIGFTSIIENELQSFESSSEQAEILTTNHTALQPGFLLFLFFTLSSLYFSYLLFKRLKIELPTTPHDTAPSNI